MKFFESRNMMYMAISGFAVMFTGAAIFLYTSSLMIQLVELASKQTLIPYAISGLVITLIGIMLLVAETQLNGTKQIVALYREYWKKQDEKKQENKE